MKKKLPRGPNLIGKTIGQKGIVVDYCGPDNWRQSTWLVKCGCGTEFITTTSLINGARSKKPIQGCVQCGKIRMGLNNIKDLTGTICGRWHVLQLLDQRTKNNDTIYLCVCECGTIREVHSISLRHKRSLSCGCLLREYLDTAKGNKHSCWNPDISDEERALRNTRYRLDPKTQIFRVNVFKRDKRKCQLCGVHNKNIVAHHLNGYHWCIDERYDVCNGVTLCRNCHKYFHQKYGYGNNTKEQYQEFFLLRYNG